MIEFSEDILNCVYKLRDMYRMRKHCVVVAFPVIEIVRISMNREVSTKLFYSYDTNTFEIQVPDFQAISRISYYDYDKKERRWTRDKDYIFSLIRDLKTCGLWDYISNKDFVMVNPNNKRTDPKSRLKMLNAILSADPIIPGGVGTKIK